MRKSVKPLIIKEQRQPSAKEEAQHKKTVPGPSGSETVSRVRTRSQISKEKCKALAVEESPVSKASLSDLLEAIEFEQIEPVHIEPVHIDLTQSSPESTKKSRASKRLRFDEPGDEFIFKPRRPITRKQIREAEKLPRTEVAEELSRTEEAEKIKQKYTNRTVIISQGGNIIAIKNQLEAAKHEIVKVKNATRESAVRYANYRKAVLKGSENLVNQVDSVADVYTWTVPAIKEAKLLRKINMHLRAENKTMRKKVADLKAQLGQWKKVEDLKAQLDQLADK